MEKINKEKVESDGKSSRHPNGNHNGHHGGFGHSWKVTKEKILFGLGIVLVIFEFANTELLERPFHVEFLIAALALCGVSIAQWGDKR